MGRKLYVGNLSYDVDSSQLEQLFVQHGTVQSAEVISDRMTGRSKGFGFVEMGSDEEAQAAIAAVNGQEHGGRALTVNEARPKEDRGGGGGGGYGGGGGSRGGFGGGGRGGAPAVAGAAAGAAAASAEVGAAAVAAGATGTDPARRSPILSQGGRRGGLPFLPCRPAPSRVLCPRGCISIHWQHAPSNTS